MAKDDEDMKEWARNRKAGEEPDGDEEEEAPEGAAPHSEPDGDEEEEGEEGDEEGISQEDKDTLVELVRKNLPQILEAVSEVAADSFVDVDEELEDDVAEGVLQSLEGMSPELSDAVEGIAEGDAVDVAMEVRGDIEDELDTDDAAVIDKNLALVAAFLYRAGELV